MTAHDPHAVGHRHAHAAARLALPLILPVLLLLLILLLAAFPGPIRAAESGSYYGINFVAPYEPWLTLARQSGAPTVRWQFNWRDHEPNPGQWTWEAADGPIDAWRRSGIAIDAILHNPPDWAIARPGPFGTPPWVFNGIMPRGLDQPWGSPDNGFAQFCNRFAQRYRGQISSYEIWNEPDLDNYWDGNAREYYLLMRSCYLAVKAADPDVTVVMAGMALVIEKDFFPEVLRLVSEDPAGAEHNNFFDAANIHMYGDPDAAYDLTMETRRQLETYGMGEKPIWITETNVALRGYGINPDQPRWGTATEEEAGWYIIQVASSALAAGAERLMFFRLADDGMDQAFGLVRNSGQPRPAYEALQTASNLLRDVVGAEREMRGDVTINTLFRADGSRIIVLYSDRGQETQVQVESRTAIAGLLDPLGAYSTVRPDPGGFYSLRLQTASGRDFSQIDSYSVGGPPLLLVEADESPPISAVEVQQSASEALLRWQGYDGEYGTEVAAFDVEVQRNGGDWEPWLQATTQTEARYDISAGGIYTFRVRAIDGAGNVGAFSEPGQARLTATLVARVEDLRGQPVAGALVTLADGRSLQSDTDGIVRLEGPAAEIGITRIDGGAHGLLPEPQTIQMRYNSPAEVFWTLRPAENLIPNGEFGAGSFGWEWRSRGDVRTVGNETEAILQISGARRPWGSPGASVTVSIPAEMARPFLRFSYRIQEPGQSLRLRVVSSGQTQTLWQSSQITPAFAPVILDLDPLSGHSLTLVFELYGPKGAARGQVELDDVFLGSVPLLGG